MLLSPFKHPLFERHPAVFVTAGFFFIYIVQILEAWPLAVLSGLLSIFALLDARQHWFKVLRRLKFVALAICILFAWQTPGVQILPALGTFSPTYDGLNLAVAPILRLISIAAVVAILKTYLSTDAWVGSLYVLSWPLGMFGLSRERLAMRLRLVLDYVEDTRLNWRALLQTAPDAPVAAHEIQCQVEMMSVLDRCIITTFFLVALGVSVW